MKVSRWITFSCLYLIPVQIAGGDTALTLRFAHRPLDPPAAHVAALESWLLERSCPLRVLTADDGEPADMVFSVVPTEDRPRLGFLAIAEPDVELRSVWLMRRTTAAVGLPGLAGEGVALLSQGSPLGHDMPRAMLRRVGLDDADYMIFIADNYQGAVTVLLHGDVMAAAVPSPLARRWAEANDLEVVAESDIAFVAGFVLRDGVMLSTACRAALSTLQREGRRDQRMKLFPEWVNRFRQVAP